jgi:hypothetical protein
VWVSPGPRAKVAGAGDSALQRHTLLAPINPAVRWAVGDQLAAHLPGILVRSNDWPWNDVDYDITTYGSHPVVDDLQVMVRLGRLFDVKVGHLLFRGTLRH